MHVYYKMINPRAWCECIFYKMRQLYDNEPRVQIDPRSTNHDRSWIKLVDILQASTMYFWKGLMGWLLAVLQPGNQL
jgi:hypothetical protein